MLPPPPAFKILNNVLVIITILLSDGRERKRNENKVIDRLFACRHIFFHFVSTIMFYSGHNVSTIFTSIFSPDVKAKELSYIQIHLSVDVLSNSSLPYFCFREARHNSLTRCVLR